MDLGDYHYNFIVDNAFFEQFPDEEMLHGKVNLALDIEKESRLMVMQFHFNGNLRLACDRCLEMYEQPLQGNFRLIVKYGEKEEEISEELMTIPFDTSRFDIAPYVYEFIRLMIPIKRVHPDDENGNPACNAAMLEKLEEYGEQHQDPRWNVLKNLKKEITD